MKLIKCKLWATDRIVYIDVDTIFSITEESDSLSATIGGLGDSVTVKGSAETIVEILKLSGAQVINDETFVVRY